MRADPCQNSAAGVVVVFFNINSWIHGATKEIKIRVAYITVYFCSRTYKILVIERFVRFSSDLYLVVYNTIIINHYY